MLGKTFLKQRTSLIDPNVRLAAGIGGQNAYFLKLMHAR